MSSARKLKRHLSDSEDGSKSDYSSGAETKNMTLHRSTKKKKIYLESDSENELALSNQTSTKDEEKSDETSDEVEPLKNVAEKSKIDVSSDSSDDENSGIIVKSKNSSACSRSKSENIDLLSVENGYEATSDEDKPSGNISIPSKLTEKVHNSSSRSDKRLLTKGRNNASSSSDDEPLISKSRNNSSSSSDDEPLISKSRNNSQGVKSKSAKSRESEEDKLQVTSNDEDEPIKQVQEVLKFKGKPKDLGVSSDDSDDEPLAANRSSTKNLNKKIKALDSESEKNKSDLTSDEDEPLNKLVKPSKASGNSKGVTSANSSDDEPLITKSKASKQMKNSRKAKTQKPQSITNGYNSSDEEEPLSKFTAGSKSKGKPKRKKQDSNSSSDDEPSAIKKSVKQKSEAQKNGAISSDDEDESISNLLKVPKEKTNNKKKQDISSSSDDEPLATKKLVKQKSKAQKDGGLSSDDEDESLSNLLKAPKEKSSNKKDKNSSNAKIEQLKKYLRTAGIHVQSYDKLFENCKSIKSKVEKLLDVLHEKGLKGRPTIEKCKKLKKKIETKKEIAELDTSNIIKSEGRPKRGAVGKVLNTESSPVAKKFSRLQDIIDTEESD